MAPVPAPAQTEGGRYGLLVEAVTDYAIWVLILIVPHNLGLRASSRRGIGVWQIGPQRNFGSFVYCQLRLWRRMYLTEIDHKELLKWAIAQSGQTYFLSLLSDFSTDPQWRPEWVEARFLVADVCGRALNVAARMPSESVPQGWKTRTETVRAWVEDNDYQFLASFPAVMEGARRLNKPALEQMQTLIPPYERRINERTVDHLLLLTPAIHSFGFPPQALTSLYAVVASIRREPLAGGNNLTQHAMQLLAHISVLEQEIRHADVVAEASIEQLAFTD
jgi:hypothetical protein